MRPRPWFWRQLEREATETPEHELVDGYGKTRALVWVNAPDRCTWHTFDADGVGGENAEARSLQDAKDLAVAAVVRQGWAPGGWEVSW